MKTLFVYGTLKMGFNNRKRFMPNSKVLMNVHITGYDMYTNGHYPAIVRNETPGNGLIHGELHEVDEQTFDRIRDMEFGAGYHIADYKIMGQSVPLFAMNREQVSNGQWKPVVDGIFKQ